MIKLVDETGSTNADLLERVRSGEIIPEGEWLVARRQNSGRGRQGRDWYDGTGNFMGSTVVQRLERDPPTHTLALVSGLAVYEAVLPLCPQPTRLMLKWPNDLLLNDAKLCGILLETDKNCVVVGVGVNLMQAPEVEGRSTIALSEICKAPEIENFAARLAQSFDAELGRWRNFGIDPLIRRWIAAGYPIGTPLKVHDKDESLITGEFGGLSPEGSLLLRLANGETRVIHAGDVMLDKGA